MLMSPFPSENQDPSHEGRGLARGHSGTDSIVLTSPQEASSGPANIPAQGQLLIDYGLHRLPGKLGPWIVSWLCHHLGDPG